MEISVICVSNERSDRFEDTLNNIVERALVFNRENIKTEVILKFPQESCLLLDLPEFVKVVYREDTSIYEAMNQALEVATGNWCVFINSGDRFLLDPLDFLKLPSRDMSYVGKFIFDGELRSNSKYFKWNGKSICHQSVLIQNKNIVFSTEYKHISDYIYFIGAGNLVFTDIIVANYGSEPKTSEYKRRNKWEKCQYNASNYRPVSFLFAVLRLFRHEIGL